jgi:WD40 repeat protein
MQGRTFLDVAMVHFYGRWLLACWLALAFVIPLRSEEKPLRTDRYGDPLPPGAIARLGTVRFRHCPYVLRAAFSPDERMIASLGGDDCIRLWDAASGKEIGKAAVKADIRWYMRDPLLEFSPDGKSLAVGSGQEIINWEAKVGGAIRHLPKLPDEVSCLAYASGGNILAAGCGEALLLLDPITGKELRRLTGHKDKVLCVAFSADDKVLASGGADETCRLWDVAAGKELSTLATGLPPIMLTLSPDKRLLAWTNQWDSTVRVLDVNSGKLKDSVSFPKDDSVVSLYDRIGTLRFTADGTLVALRHDPLSLCCWHPHKRLESRFLGHVQGQDSKASLSPKGKSAVAWSDRNPTLRFFDIDTGRERDSFQAHAHHVSSVAASPRGRLVASVGWDDSIRLWDPGTLREVHRWQPGRGTTGALAFAPDGKVLTIGSREGAKLKSAIRSWDVATGREWRRFDTDANSYFAFSTDGKHLIAAGRTQVQVLDPDNGKLILEMEDVPEVKLAPIQIDPIAPFQSFQIIAFALSPDGKRVAAVFERARSERLYFWNTANGKRLSDWAGQQDLHAPITFSPDGKTFAACRKRNQNELNWDVTLWEMATGKERASFPLTEQGCSSLAFSPDGKLLAIANEYDGAIHVWNVPLGKEAACFRGHHGAAQLVFSADGRTLISGGDDTTLLVWDIRGSN